MYLPDAFPRAATCLHIPAYDAMIELTDVAPSEHTPITGLGAEQERREPANVDSARKAAPRCWARAG